MTAIALISMPWRRPNNAAVGLGLLKAIAQDAGVRCDVHYLNDRWFHLVCDPALLHHDLRALRFSERSRVISELAGIIQAGEWVFARHLFGEAIPGPDEYARLFERATTPNAYHRYYRDLVQSERMVAHYFEECFAETEWDAYDAIGFSCVFYQLTPSLSFAAFLREKGFKGEILFGGPLCEGPVGPALLREFPFVDAVFDGEADNSFQTYARTFARRGAAQLPGVWRRGADGSIAKDPGPTAVRDMNALPIPDYSDFFADLGSKQIGVPEVAFPVEGSRGCWWGERHHCVFCGLNGADMAHRMKTADRIYTELHSLHSQYGVKHFAFTDNIVSPKFMKPLTEKLKQNPLSVTFHAEIKSNLSRHQVQSYRDAGFIYLQPGIESLSSNVLGIIDKGVTALHNVACLKFCKEASITAFWNLLYGFPGETEHDYEKTLAILPSIVHLQPPEVVNAMRLTRFSPSFTRSEELGFHNRRPASFYKLIFPVRDEALCNLVNTFEFDFADHLDRDALVGPIEAFVKEWRAHENPGLLVYDRVPIPTLFDTRFTRKIAERALTALEDWIVTTCDMPVAHHKLIALLQRSPLAREHDEACLRDALHGLLENRFLIEEGSAYLSLALVDSTFVPWQALAVAGMLSDGDLAA